MSGVGPAGRLFTAPKVRGRSMVVMIGGSIKVGGRTPQMKDYTRRSSAQPYPLQDVETNAYSELSRTPQALNDAQLVEGHCSEQELCRIIIAALR